MHSTLFSLIRIPAALTVCLALTLGTVSLHAQDDGVWEILSRDGVAAALAPL